MGPPFFPIASPATRARRALRMSRLTGTLTPSLTTDVQQIEHRNATFTVKQDHLKLLKASVVSWTSRWDGSMFGAACIDPERPYGDQDVYRSMIRILDWKLNRGDEAERRLANWDIETDEIPFDEMNRLEQLHQETEIALASASLVESSRRGSSSGRSQVASG